MVKNNKLAPIIIFTYNRQDHTQKTIEALEKNKWSEDTDVIVYSDAPRNNDDKSDVENCRKYLDTVKAFKNITIVKRNTNYGLAKNIISGVTEVINKYGNVIVMEDDLVTSPYFIVFMNKALDYYKNKTEIWHISGWNYPVKLKNHITQKDTFLWNVMSCSGGWATWSDRWKYFEKNPQKLIESFTKKDIYRFDIEGSSYMWGQILANNTGELNTWAIFWYATIFQKKGLCVNPTLSYVKNIGHDNSGVHCKDSEYSDNEILCMNDSPKFEDDLIEDKSIRKAIKLWHKKQKKTFITKVFNKLSKFFK